MSQTGNLPWDSKELAIQSPPYCPIPVFRERFHAKNAGASKMVQPPGCMVLKAARCQALRDRETLVPGFQQHWEPYHSAKDPSALYQSGFFHSLGAALISRTNSSLISTPSPGRSLIAIYPSLMSKSPGFPR